MEKQIRIVRQGVGVEENQKCLICDDSLIYGTNVLGKLKIFECKHGFHEDCIQLAVSFNILILKLFFLFYNFNLKRDHVLSVVRVISDLRINTIFSRIYGFNSCYFTFYKFFKTIIIITQPF